jgi:hypothetical protein
MMVAKLKRKKISEASSGLSRLEEIYSRAAELWYHTRGSNSGQSYQLPPLYLFLDLDSVSEDEAGPIMPNECPAMRVMSDVFVHDADFLQ